MTYKYCTKFGKDNTFMMSLCNNFLCQKRKTPQTGAFCCFKMVRKLTKFASNIIFSRFLLRCGKDSIGITKLD